MIFITDQEFGLFQNLIREQAAISLFARQKDSIGGQARQSRARARFKLFHRLLPTCGR